MLIGGQACVFYGAAEFTRDLDLLFFVDDANIERLMAALEELQCRPIAVPDFDVALLNRGHAIHYRCEAPGVEGLRIDEIIRKRRAERRAKGLPEEEPGQGIGEGD